MKTLILIPVLLFFSFSNAQSDVDKILKGGEIIINGLSFLKKDTKKYQKILHLFFLMKKYQKE